MRKPLPVVLILSLFTSAVLAGCMEPMPAPDVEGEDTAAAGDSATGGPHGNGEGEEKEEQEKKEEAQEQPPEPPTATLTVDNASGQRPLTVTFSVDGVHPEGGGLTWTLDPGDGGSATQGDAVPAQVEHTYTESGTFTATLSVSDGGLTAQAELTVAVSDPPPPPPPPPGPNPPQAGENTLCLDHIVLWAVNQEPGPGGIHSPLDDPVDVDPGTSYMILTVEGTGVVDFYDTNGYWIEMGGSSGDVPDGAAYGYVCVVVDGDLPAVPLPQGFYVYIDGF